MKLGIKFLAILIVCLLFSAVMFSINDLVEQRQALATQVNQEMAEQYVSEQTALAPFALIPIIQNCAPPIIPSANVATCTERTRWVSVPATEANWSNDLQVDDTTLKRGIYHSMLFQNHMSYQAQYDFNLLNLSEHEHIAWEKAQWVWLLSDQRGLNQAPDIDINGQKQAMQLVLQAHPRIEGAYYAAPITNPTDKTVKMGLQAAFSGTSQLSILPLAATQIHMQSPWSHPKFSGSNLPQSRQVQDSGFKANWNSAFMNESNQQYLQQCLSSAACKLSLNNASEWQTASLSIFNPINVYTLSDRAIKYALLFVLMVFGTFGLFEVLKDLRVHPVQYGLVGAALAVFYLLLLSLSEHLGFTLAYVIAASACVTLIGCYVAAVLHSWLRASVLSALLISLYGVLYFLLHTSEWTLILGSGMVFVALAVIMLLTRKLDWYGLEQRHVYRMPSGSESDSV